MKKTSKPTDAELDILNVLWGKGPSTVREVHEEIQRNKSLGYTTILKQMQIMVEKGLLTRDTSKRTHVFQPAVSQDSTQKGLVSRLMDSAFGGSATKLVMQALGHRKASPEELDQIRALLDDIESEQGDKSNEK